MKNTELQKRNCEMENSCSEALKNKSVPSKKSVSSGSPRDFQLGAYDQAARGMTAGPARKKFFMREQFRRGPNVSPTVMRGVGHHFFSIRRHLDPELNRLAVQFVEWV
jgi:hypothetical protein